MQLLVLAVGTRQPDWVNNGYNEYARRFPSHLNLQLKEIPAAKRGKSTSIDKLKQDEAEKILGTIPDGAFVVALDEHGKSVNTRELSGRLADWLQGGQDVVFMIGGADGLDDSCLQRANWRWSLSPLTLPHGLVRVMLAEQLYRANSLLEGHPYHRE